MKIRPLLLGLLAAGGSPRLGFSQTASTGPYVKNVEGSSTTAIAHLRDGKVVSLDGQPRWKLSPDKSLIALDRQGGEHGLFLIDTDNGAIRREVLLVNTPENDEGSIDFVWSPDGRAVAFTVGNQRAYPKRARLFVADVRAHSHWRAEVASIDAVADQGCVLFNPGWSPDGKNVGVIDERRFTVFDPAGRKLRTVGLPPEYYEYLRPYFRDVVWDADGTIVPVLQAPDIEPRWTAEGREVTLTLHIPGLKAGSFSVSNFILIPAHVEPEYDNAQIDEYAWLHIRYRVRGIHKDGSGPFDVGFDYALFVGGHSIQKLNRATQEDDVGRVLFDKL